MSTIITIAIGATLGYLLAAGVYYLVLWAVRP